ncbi:hypothetical protein L228DRAFT_172940 [Xylona heveae TC161]|uniref:Uncharacterized protein n=1 Tax=Xylona heveae (strain CBS 132557 / TC161) TaxID=1328760 RepID=A0A165FW04_XYLHT|nr:hypothetical protein L228DRAFT_172940 [Xylona heveae TC161]KZF21447.1 hypothetical protein L228DRAFT_172940 [Xylona heveae TC161]
MYRYMEKLHRGELIKGERVSTVTIASLTAAVDYYVCRFDFRRTYRLSVSGPFNSYYLGTIAGCIVNRARGKLLFRIIQRYYAGKGLMISSKNRSEEAVQMRMPGSHDILTRVSYQDLCFGPFFLLQFTVLQFSLRDSIGFPGVRLDKTFYFILFYFLFFSF